MKRLLATVVFMYLGMASQAHAANVLPLFSDESSITAVLSAPLTQVYSHKKDDVRLYMPATVSFLDPDGTKRRLDLTVKTRGVFRRAHCRLPPLLLNFKKKSVADTLFAGQDKIKLVSPCSATNNNQQRLILEYLAYKAFEKVSDTSLKTRLIRMSYIDTDNKKKPWTHLTFFIEDESDLARRQGMKAIHVPKVRPDQLDPVQAMRVELFQFMIGNTDFSMTGVPGQKDCCHNLQILGHKGSDRGYAPVPYDFDSAGLIDADYAAPSAKLPIKDVKKRLFRGRCRSDDVVSEAIESFRESRSDILALFADSTHLNNRFRKKSVQYLEEFFDILDSPKKVQTHIAGRCRGK